jgi:signal peptidase II
MARRRCFHRRRVRRNDFLWIIHVRNKAIAFSIGHGLPDGLRSLLFILLPLGVLARSSSIISGRMSSRRPALGGVRHTGRRLRQSDRPHYSDPTGRDFISVNFYGLLGLSLPTFNVADSSLVVCGALLFVSVFFASGVEREGEKA